MANIYPTIKVDILVIPNVTKNILLGSSCSSKEVPAYKASFKEFHDVFALAYVKINGLGPTLVKHHIHTWPNVFLI